MPSSLSEQSAAAAAEKQGASADDGADGSDSDSDDEFARLELEIADTASELAEDKNILLADFADEYDKLSRALKSAHEKAKRLGERCRLFASDGMACPRHQHRVHGQNADGVCHGGGQMSIL